MSLDAGLSAEAAARSAELHQVMRRLRAECDWKRAQTHRSLARYLLEETHETLDAIDEGAESGDWSHLREELGDLLLQVYFHCAIAEESGQFTTADVTADLLAKLRRRNPHVFGEASATGAAEVNALWESVKAAERPHRAVADGLASTLPALLYADKVLERLERAGQAGASADAPAGETLGSDSIGERLLALVAEARRAGVDPEQALRDTVRARL